MLCDVEGGNEKRNAYKTNPACFPESYSCLHQDNLEQIPVHSPPEAVFLDDYAPAFPTPETLQLGLEPLRRRR